MRFANSEILQRALDARNPGQVHWDETQAEIDARETPAIKLDPSTLDLTVPEMDPGPYVPGQDLIRDKYIRQYYGSGITMLPNGEQGPSQGPNTPIKNYGGMYMPDGTQPSGYYPRPKRV